MCTLQKEPGGNGIRGELKRQAVEHRKRMLIREQGKTKTGERVLRPHNILYPPHILLSHTFKTHPPILALSTKFYYNIPMKSSAAARLAINHHTYSLAKDILTESLQEPPDKDAVIKFLHHILDDALESIFTKTTDSPTDSIELLWRKLHGYWVSMCGLPPLRRSAAIEEDALREAISIYGVDKIIESIDNFSKIYRHKRTYAWVERMEFDEFIVRGYETFLTENDPFNKFRRVTKTDYDCLTQQPRKKGFSVPKRDLDKLRTLLERNIGRVAVGRDF